MTPAEQARTVFDLQSLIIARDARISELEADLASNSRQRARMTETIIGYRNADRIHKSRKAFVLFHFNEFVAGRIDIREVPFVDEIRAMLDDEEEPK